MRAIRAILALAALAACGPMPAPSPTPSAAEVDSIALERSSCLGGCPPYRVSVARDGAVRFRSHIPGDSTTAADRVDAAAFDALAREAERIGLWTFVHDRSLCAGWTSDNPTVTVTIHVAGEAKSVRDDHGCHGPDERLAALRRFEARIDSVGGSARWARPWHGR